MLADLPYRVWREWKLYYRSDPFDGVRGDIRTAQLSAIMANAWFRDKKRRKPWTIEDWMPKYGDAEPEREPESEEERAERLLAYVRDLNTIFGGDTVDGARDNAS